VKRQEFIALVGGAAVAWPLATRAQQAPGKIARVSYLSPARIDHVLQAFLKGLGELGYTEGRNIQIKYRFAEGHLDRMDKLTSEAVQAVPDVIVAVGVAAAVPAKRATTSIPIVMAPVADPVQAGLVPNLVLSNGGNITGVSLYASELNQKRIEVLKEAFPGVRRVGVLVNTSNMRSPDYWRDMHTAGERLDLETQARWARPRVAPRVYGRK
jgi:putative tryptophan/tyrosine transport system substrate-binding protein